MAIAGFRAAAVAGALAALAACETSDPARINLSRGQCAAIQWDRQGLRDGERGAPVSTLRDYVETCSRHGVAPDEEAWRAGWEAARKRSGDGGGY